MLCAALGYDVAVWAAVDLAGPHTERAAQARRRRARAGPTAAVAAGSGGPVALHAMAVKGRDDEYAFVVERPRPATLARVIMHAHGLTEREQQIAVAVLHGATSRHIARDFGVSVHTVNDHIEAIYGKLGVGSRGELSARLLTAHLPQRARGATPGPYGWFL